jgi:hypothetical protein
MLARPSGKLRVYKPQDKIIVRDVKLLKGTGDDTTLATGHDAKH